MEIPTANDDDTLSDREGDQQKLVVRGDLRLLIRHYWRRCISERQATKLATLDDSSRRL